MPPLGNLANYGICRIACFSQADKVDGASGELALGDKLLNCSLLYPLCPLMYSMRFVTSSTASVASNMIFATTGFSCIQQ